MDLQQRDELVAAALVARQRAYAPYSNFLVGAALRAANGDIFVGCNVENASYGLTLCAERAAMVQAVSSGHREFHALAVAASGGVTPCGACRQVLAEFGDQLAVLVVDADQPGRVTEMNLRELLPHRFVLRSRDQE